MSEGILYYNVDESTVKKIQGELVENPKVQGENSSTLGLSRDPRKIQPTLRKMSLVGQSE